MIILGYKIQRNASLRENPLSIIVLGLAIVLFYQAMMDSGYFAYYRLGDSIIPKENQLVRSGPYIMQEIKIRNGYLVRFQPISGGQQYSETWSNFEDSFDILALVKKFENQPVAYLWLYPDNPVRQVWKIEVNQRTVFSYNTALYFYQRKSRSQYYLGSTAMCFVMFLISMFNMTRVE